MTNYKLLTKGIVLILLSSLHHQIIASPDNKLNVVASCSMIEDIAYQIGKDRIQLSSIVAVGGDPHVHEPTSRDAKLVVKGQLILVNGLTFEGWLTELIDNSGSQGEVVTVTEGITPLQSEDYSGSPDPHAWMDIENGFTYARNIKEALIRLDKKNAEFYQTNYDAYTKEIAKLSTYIAKEINKIPERFRVLITSHDAFQYFGRAYGLKLEAVMGTSTEADVQVAEMRKISKLIRETGVPAVFIESTVNPKQLEQIAKDNGAVIGGKLFADSLGEKGGEADTYLKMLKYNIDTIVNALAKDKKAVDANSSHKHVSTTGPSALAYGLLDLLIVAILLFVVVKLNH